MPYRNAPRLASFDYIGPYSYFVTMCTVGRIRLFTTEAAVARPRDQLRDVASAEGFAIPAYCFMPDHLHLLIEARADSCNGLKFIARAKQFSGFYYTLQIRRTLWQRYGYEHVLRDDEDTRGVARYIFENPVRASLVQSPQNYPFLGSDTHSVSEVLEFTSG